MRIIGLDLGTSFFKGAILDLDNGRIEHIRRLPTPAAVAGLPSGHHELQPAVVMEAVRTLLSELLITAPDAGGLVMCGQMHCVVLVDSSGKPRSNIITWKDQRGADGMIGHLLRLVTRDEQRQIGREMRVGLPIVNLSWLRAEDPFEPGLIPTSLADFVLSQLCGVLPTTEATNAAAYGLFNVETGGWHGELIDKLGLADLRWPHIRPFGEVVGTAEIDGRRLTCFTPVGDQQCALAGAELAPRELSLNISTGSQISLLSDKPVGGEYQVRPYFDAILPLPASGRGPGGGVGVGDCETPPPNRLPEAGRGNRSNAQWLRTIVQIPAGRSLQALVNLLTEMGAQGDPWEYTAQQTENAPASDLDIDLAFFKSEFGSTGSITSIRETNLNVANLFVAAFRNMAKNYARCAERLSPNREWDRVVFSGGLAQRFGRLRREILERLGNPQWRISAIEEDTLHGLLTLAKNRNANRR